MLGGPQASGCAADARGVVESVFLSTALSSSAGLPLFCIGERAYLLLASPASSPPCSPSSSSSVYARFFPERALAFFAEAKGVLWALPLALSLFTLGLCLVDEDWLHGDAAREAGRMRLFWLLPGLSLLPGVFLMAYSGAMNPEDADAAVGVDDARPE